MASTSAGLDWLGDLGDLGDLVLLALDGCIRVLVDERRRAVLHFPCFGALFYQLEHVALLEQRGLPVVLRPRLELR